MNTEGNIGDESTSVSQGIEVESADVLVVTSKIKKYIKTTAGLSTSKETIDVLSAAVQRMVNAAIENAKSAGRKTVMARDFE